jgi:thiosulfate reductase/polysulfide reductase chain A
VVLPLSPYLERESIVASKNGLKPQFFVRDRAVEPRYDTRADWEIISGLAKRLNLPELVFDSIDDIRKFQLEGTGVDLEDFKEKGFVALSDQPSYPPPRFKTPSGKFEIISEALEKQGLPSLKPYESPKHPPEGQFRLTFGRCALHTQGHTVNNPMLAEQMPENELWINREAARKLGLTDGGRARVSRNRYSEHIKVKMTDVIHPEAVFVVHGFGHQLPVETRAFGKGLADNKFMQGGLDLWDPAGGAVAYQEFFVEVSKA